MRRIPAATTCRATTATASRSSSSRNDSRPREQPGA
jgi:hypothetical protein